MTAEIVPAAQPMSILNITALVIGISRAAKQFLCRNLWLEL